ncbi:class I SAM-dependent methyltransferase [Cohnella cellulosilytica]|uniref:Class I SAM-dependent methyltransferase n=1 Tax=Cohnella cellulosilytica TaxID=986710 RepID=A0ABW2F3E4_9BACL
MQLKEISRYWTSGAAAYDKVVRSQIRSRRTVRMWEALLREGLGARPGQKVLDVGTGPGFFSLLLARMGHRPTAVDASPGMVETAARNFKEAGADVRVYEGDAANLPREEDDTYDAVVCRDVVWTLPDPVGAYREWFRVLKPGGRLVVFDGNYLFELPSGWKYRLWYALAWTLILLTERRARRRSDETEPSLKELPFVRVLRPEADEATLRGIGYHVEEIRRNYMSGYKRTLQHLKYGHLTGVRFRIIASKPGGTDLTH